MTDRTKTLPQIFELTLCIIYIPLLLFDSVVFAIRVGRHIVRHEQAKYLCCIQQSERLRIFT